MIKTFLIIFSIDFRKILSEKLLAKKRLRRKRRMEVVRDFKAKIEKFPSTCGTNFFLLLSFAGDGDLYFFFLT